MRESILIAAQIFMGTRGTLYNMNRVHYRTFFLLGGIALSFAALFFALPTSAQLLTQSAVLETNPRTPAPFSNVEISLNAYSMNTAGASIRWYVDGTEVTSAQNERSMTLQTGALGKTQSVRAAVSIPNAGSFSATKSITPTVIDLIVEGDTLVPTFYKGRALPTSGEPLTVVAIPQNGSGKSAASYSYRWQMDQQTLFGGPVLGKHRIDITMPQYASVLSVVVYDAAGLEVGSSALNLFPARAELYFYEENPLRGLSSKAVTPTATLIGEESTFRAQPYFMAANIFNNPLATWSINGGEVSTNETDAGAITLRKEGGSGTALIDFSISNPAQPLQYIENSFNLYFE